MLKSKIGTVESIMLILTIIITHTILSLSQRLLVTTKSSTIINIIYVSILAIIISYLVFRLFKNFPGLDILEISEMLGGKVFKNIVGIIFMLHLLLYSFFS